MRLLAIALALTLAAPAFAEPSQPDLDARAAALEKRLGADGFTVVIEPPFVIVGDESPAMVRHRATGILRWSIHLLQLEYFPKRPDKLIEIWLFKNERTYRRGAKKYFGDTPDTPYGYYSSAHDAMIMNIGPGAGTLVHEVVHPFMEANFPDVPSWFNEGLASLYEYPDERGGHIYGHVNWRLPNLKREIRAKTLPTMATLLGTTTDEFYAAQYDAYAFARYLMYYLQEHGKLRAFYVAFQSDAKDKTGRAALEGVLGEKLETFEPKWRAWVLTLNQ
ncbi:MAG TPA: DUF1570 domain-containing protein [Kofleriaceae bacterium]|jgi:hypothetical protein